MNLMKANDLVKPAGERWEERERNGVYRIAELRGERVLITYLGKTTAAGFEPCDMRFLPMETVLMTDIQPV